MFEAEPEAVSAVLVELAGQMEERVTGPEAAELMVFAGAAALTTLNLQVSPTTVSFNQTLVTTCRNIPKIRQF